MQVATGYQILLEINHASVMVTLLLMEHVNNVLIYSLNVQIVYLVMVHNLEICILVHHQVLVHMRHNISIANYVLGTFGIIMTKGGVPLAILHSMDV